MKFRRIIFTGIILALLSLVVVSCKKENDTYTVTYYANKTDAVFSNGKDKMLDSSAYKEGVQVRILDVEPHVDGATFKCWTMERDGSGVEYKTGEVFTMPAEPVKFYAQWN